MHSLKPITALGRTDAQIDVIGTLTIRECPNWSLASVSARLGAEKTTQTAFKKALGLEFPKPMESTQNGAVTAFWTGPDQCFVEAPFDSHETLCMTLVASLQERASVTEQSDGWVRFDIEELDCISLLERCCAVDTASLPMGGVARTIVEHLSCFILCRSEHHFSVYGPRSSAGSLHHGLTTAARSVLAQK